MRNLLGVVVFLLGLGGAIEACSKHPAVNVENAAALAQYKALLSSCEEKGKDAGSYAVYERCANDVDRHLCELHGLRCMDGGR